MTEDKCAPWKLPEVEHTTRQEVKTSSGWQILYKCSNESTPEGLPRFLSYYYPNGEVIHSCTTGNSFVPEKLISCQGKPM